MSLSQDVILTRFETPDEIRAGDVFYVPPHPHDSWVVGNEPYVSLHFMGATAYASNKSAN